MCCCSVLQCVPVPELEGKALQTQPQSRSVLQCVAVCCSVLQCVAVCCSVWQCVAVCCCSVLQCVPVPESEGKALQTQPQSCSVLQCVAVCCSVLQCVAVCANALQCVLAVCCSVLQYIPLPESGGKALQTQPQSPQKAYGHELASRISRLPTHGTPPRQPAAPTTYPKNKKREICGCYFVFIETYVYTYTYRYINIYVYIYTCVC